MALRELVKARAALGRKQNQGSLKTRLGINETADYSSPSTMMAGINGNREWQLKERRLNLPQMVPALQAILLSELARGNKIRSVDEWPPKCRLLVLLDRPFKKKYSLTIDIDYEDVNDPHYWKAEYNYKNGVECLACSF